MLSTYQKGFQIEKKPLNALQSMDEPLVTALQLLECEDVGKMIDKNTQIRKAKRKYLLDVIKCL